MVSQTIVLHLPRPVRRRVCRLSLKTRHKVVFRRCQIVLQLAKGARPAAIAAAFGCDLSTVYRTRQAFLQVGEASLIPKKSPGRPRRVTAQQERELEQTLAREPRAGQELFELDRTQSEGAFALAGASRHRWPNAKQYVFGAVNSVTGALVWVS